MIEKPKLIHSHQDKKYCISLHPHIVDILFEHRRYVKSIFLHIKGYYEIDYFGINIINPENELVSFSSMPHIEYNLIQQKLWSYDRCFSSKDLNKNTLFWWDEINVDNPFIDQIKKIRLVNTHFKVGMTLSREMDGFYFLYSYATNSSKKELKEYYWSQLFDLIDIGDYFCNSVLNLYSEYCGNYFLPRLHQLHSKAPDWNIRSMLKLIVNNG